MISPRSHYRLNSPVALSPVHFRSERRVHLAFKAARLAEGAARETINNDLGAISVLASFALERGWIEQRPKIRRYKSVVRINYLERDRLAAYMASLRRPFRPLFELLVGTGVRLGEAEALRPADLKVQADGASRAIIRDSKTPDGVRAVFVPQWVRDSLLRHIEERDVGDYDRLFPFRRRTIQSEHERACGLAGIEGYTTHDHRHTAAVHLARSGMPLNLLQQQLGHARVEQTMQYARFHPDYGDVREYFERVESSLGLAESGNSLGNTPETVIDPTNPPDL